MGQIEFVMCGSAVPDEDLNPYKATAPETRQNILSLINLKALSFKELAGILGLTEEEIAEHLAALERAGLIEESFHRYKPTFAIFTVEDQKKLEPLISEMAGLFAEGVRNNMDIICGTYADCGFAEHGFAFVDLAYILVGAYILDYGGLGELKKSGHLMIAKEMPGGTYVFAGFEGKPRDLRTSWIWGHAYPFGPFTFFGHGELPPKGPRRAFPEQAYQWLGEGWPKEKVDRVMEELGTILFTLDQAPLGIERLAEQTGLEQGKLAEHLALLQNLGYMQGVKEGGWRSLCPVVDGAAKARIQRMVQEIWEKLLSEAVKPHWKNLEHIYQGTTLAKNGIDIREAFNPIYHWIFDQALRLLLEGGIIPWPKRHADGARYAVWIEHVKG